MNLPTDFTQPSPSQPDAKNNAFDNDPACSGLDGPANFACRRAAMTLVDFAVILSIPLVAGLGLLSTTYGGSVAAFGPPPAFDDRLVTGSITSPPASILVVGGAGGVPCSVQSQWSAVRPAGSLPSGDPRNS